MQDEEYQAMAVDAVSADQFDRVPGPRGLRDRHFCAKTRSETRASVTRIVQHVRRVVKRT